MQNEVVASEIKDAVHTVHVSLFRVAVSNGVSIGDARVALDFQKGQMRIADPFSRLTRVLSLTDYDNFEGDMLAFVAAVLSGEV